MPVKGPRVSSRDHACRHRMLPGTPGATPSGVEASRSQKVRLISEAPGDRFQAIRVPQGEVLRDIGHKKGPSKSLIAFGYAGLGTWRARGRTARYDWLMNLEDPSLLFDDDSKKVWDDSMARMGQPL